jgi:hypothetical protein
MENLTVIAIQKYMREHGHLFTEKFGGWLLENWKIYLEFERQAHHVIASGRKHYSARTIVEYIRHQTLLAEAGGAFKINNNTVADLARLFAIRYPNYKNIFEYRTTKSHAIPMGVVK